MDDSRDADDRLRDLPEWLEEFTDNLEDTEVHALRAHFSGLRFGTSCESGIKITEAQYLYSLHKRPKLRSLLAIQMDKGSLQKTLWRSSTSIRKFGDLITADHKVFNEGCESRNNHRHAVVVQDLATQWIQSYPCTTKSSHETDMSL